jgi:DNA modification methylase
MVSSPHPDAWIICGDVREKLATLPDECIRTCVTSPPYFGLRDYGVAGQIGLEATPDAFVAEMVDVFREVRRVLTNDGTLWLNLGDSYAPNWSSQRSTGGGGFKTDQSRERWTRLPGIPPKNLLGIPWRVAFALQADGWYLRQDIIWHKPNPMPESVTDRCTKAHEYIFLFAKSPRYYFDAEANKEESVGKWNSARSTLAANGTKNVHLYQTGQRRTAGADTHHPDEWKTGRNRRSVWTVTTKPFKGAHFATFPPDLIEPCVLAGSAPGDTVLDPFNGSGTTGIVSVKHGRRYVGIELNPEYVEITNKRFQEHR